MFTGHTVMGIVLLLFIATQLSNAAAIGNDVVYTFDVNGILDNTPGNGAVDMTEDYMEMFMNADQQEVQNAIAIHQNYTYIINNADVCSGEVFVLALIKSSPESTSARQEIRNTWGSVKTHGGLGIKHVFIMGATKAHGKSDTIANSLLKESDQYGDIVQGDFTGHFRNQTCTTIMGLNWVRRYCSKAKFVLNTNDNTMVDPYHLVDFLTKSKYTGNFMYCSTFLNLGPSRSPSDKLFVTLHEYPYRKYPPHCDGFANIMSSDVVSRLLEAAADVPWFWIDDVYVTGFLALKANVAHTDMLDGHAYNLMQKEHIEHDVASSMFLLAGYGDLRRHWHLAWQAIVQHNL